jgi:hypothetical protein
MFGSLADGSLSIIGQGRSFGKLGQQSATGNLAIMNRDDELKLMDYRKNGFDAPSFLRQAVRPNLIAGQVSDR